MDTDTQLIRILRRLTTWGADQLGIRFILSMLLSVLVWIAVTLDANPTAQTVLQEAIQVEAVDLPENVVRVGELPRVQIAVEGPKTNLDVLDPDSFVARIRLTGLGPGTHLLPVETKVTDPNVEIQRVNPSELVVRLERKTKSVIPIRLIMSGAPAEGFRAQQTAITFRPATIEIEGAEDAVRQVAFLEAKVNLGGASNNLSVQVAAQPVDSAGKQVSGILTDSNLLDVTVPIERITARKSIPIRLQIVGVPASGRVATRYSSVPSNVEIEGEPDVIEATDRIFAEPVDITGAVDDMDVTVSLIINSDIKLVRGQSTVDIRIDIDPIRNSTVFLTGILMRNLPSGMVAKLDPTTVQVLLIGAADSLRELGPTDIRAEVDLVNRAPGNHQVQPTVLIPPGIDVASVLPKTVSLTLRRLPTPTPTPTIHPSPTPDGTASTEQTPSSDSASTPVRGPTISDSPIPTHTPNAASG